MSTNYASELAAARAAAELAGREIMTLYHSFEAIADAPAEISTEADRRSQDTILQHLHGLFPQDAFCAEETTSSLADLCRSGPRLWIIDPIDGTRGFAKKIGEFSVMIGLVEENVAQLGVVLEPARGRCTYAVCGQGCWRQDGEGAPQRCRVSSMTRWHEARLVRSWSEKKNSNPTIAAVGKQIYTYSAGIKLAMVARGEADVYASTYSGFHSWDVCAGQILVEEAGGVVADLASGEVRYLQDGSGAINGTAASNGLLQQYAQAAVRGILP